MKLDNLQRKIIIDNEFYLSGIIGFRKSWGVIRELVPGIIHHMLLEEITREHLFILLNSSVSASEYRNFCGDTTEHLRKDPVRGLSSWFSSGLNGVPWSSVGSLKLMGMPIKSTYRFRTIEPGFGTPAPTSTTAGCAFFWTLAGGVNSCRRMLLVNGLLGVTTTGL